LEAWPPRVRTLLTLMGLSGGLAFVVGSVLFLNPDRYTEGVYLFVYGSTAMLLERLGRLWLDGEG